MAIGSRDFWFRGKRRDLRARRDALNPQPTLRRREAGKGARRRAEGGQERTAAHALVCGFRVADTGPVAPDGLVYLPRPNPPPARREARRSTCPLELSVPPAGGGKRDGEARPIGT